MRAYAGLDLGASNLRAVVADATGEPVGRASRRTPRGPDGKRVAAGAVETLEAAAADAGLDPGSLVGVGAAAAGVVDPTSGTVEAVPNLPDAVDGIPLRDALAGGLDDARVRVLNDATAGVLGQRRFGERRHDDVVYLTVSTGIGAGVCLDGRVLEGRTGNAGEVGHLVVDPEGAMTCGCGSPGHWEAYCSGANLPRYAAHLADTLEVGTALPLDAPDLDASTLFDRPDDPLAAATLERAAGFNAAGIAAIVHAYDPEAIYVGGGVALAHPDRLLDPVRDRLPGLTVRAPPPIRVTELGEAVVRRGALASVLPD